MSQHRCAHCGTVVASGWRICPNCGVALHQSHGPEYSHHKVTMGGSPGASPPPGRGRRITNSDWSDTLLGCTLVLMLPFFLGKMVSLASSTLFWGNLTGVGLAIILLPLIGYITLRSRYPDFARGLRMGLIVLSVALLALLLLGLLLVLGVIAICSKTKW